MAGVVHVKKRLTNISLHYPQDFDSLGEAFFPRVPAENLTDQFVSVNKANLLSLRELTPIGDDDLPPEVQIVYDADTSFSCQVYGVSSPGKWITSKNADPSLDYETERAIQLTLSLRLRLEYLQVNQRLRSAALVTNNATLTAAQRFDNYTSATSLPVKTLQIICDNIKYKAGGKRRVNHIAMTTHVLRAICRSEDFKDQVKFNAIQNAEDLLKSGEGQVAVLAQLVGVSPSAFHIADHVYNAAAAGQAESYKAFIGSDIVVAYVEPLGLRSYSATAGFQWSAYDNNPSAIISVPQYSRGIVPTEELRAFSVIDPKIIKTDLIYLLKGCVDTTDAAYGGLLD